MPTFIKTGFWDKAIKGYKEWLNLDQFVEDKINSNPGELPYKVYTALLQNISIIVLENTLGYDLTFSQDSTGIYKFNAPVDIFDKEKTFCTASFTADASVVYGQVGPFCGDLDNVWLYTYNTSGTLVDFNTACYDIMIEIRIYP